MPSIINATTTNGLVTSADNSGSLQLATNNGTTAVTIDTSQNVGIGTSSPTTKLSVSGGLAIQGTAPQFPTTGQGWEITAESSTAAAIQAYNRTGSSWLDGKLYAGNWIFLTNGSNERMRIDSDGNLLIRATSNFAAAPTGVGIKYTPAVNYGIAIGATSTSLGTAIIFLNSSNTQVGAITTDNTGTAYGTTSDYRLKENIAPMTGALDKVAQLKPVTYNWKIDGSAGQGFIAHELQEVCPDAVAGEKDAVDAQGNPVYQGVDTSFLVATLTAAIQELKAELDTVKAELQALKGTE